MTYQLIAELRDNFNQSKLHESREAGMIPAVIYGHGVANQHVLLDRIIFEKMLEQAGESSLIELVIGKAKPVNVLIKDVQKDPVTDMLIHADLQQIRMDEKVKAEIKLNFINESPAVKELGANVVVAQEILRIECLPKDLVPSIDIDLSGLTDFDQSIHVRDIVAPTGVKILDEPALPIVSIMAQKVESATTETPTAEAAVPASETAEGQIDDKAKEA